MAIGSLPNMAGALWDEEEVFCAFAALALGRIGPQAREALPFLMFRFMAASYWWERNELIEAIGRIGKPTGFYAPKLLPMLVLSLGAPDKGIRCSAAEALGRFGSTHEVVPIVLREAAE